MDTANKSGDDLVVNVLFITCVCLVTTIAYTKYDTANKTANALKKSRKKRSSVTSVKIVKNSIAVIYPSAIIRSGGFGISSLITFTTRAGSGTLSNSIFCANPCVFTYTFP